MRVRIYIFKGKKKEKKNISNSKGERKRERWKKKKIRKRSGYTLLLFLLVVVFQLFELSYLSIMLVPLQLIPLFRCVDNHLVECVCVGGEVEHWIKKWENEWKISGRRGEQLESSSHKKKMKNSECPSASLSLFQSNFSIT